MNTRAEESLHCPRCRIEMDVCEDGARCPDCGHIIHFGDGSKVKSVQVSAWTDGACSGNPGPGGWGVVLTTTVRNKQGLPQTVCKKLSGGNPATTNNEMEMQAVLQAVKALKEPCKLTVYTDSQLVVGWLQSNWHCKKPHLQKIRNEIQVLVYMGEHTLEFVKVKAHSGNPMNELADSLAKAAIPEGDQ